MDTENLTRAIDETGDSFDFLLSIWRTHERRQAAVCNSQCLMRVQKWRAGGRTAVRRWFWEGRGGERTGGRTLLMVAASLGHFVQKG